MDFLTGRHDNTIDEKGRVILPAPFRKITAKESDGQYMIYFDEEDQCLQVYTKKEFKEQFIDKFKKLSITNKNHRAYLSMIGENSMETKLDNQGRIKIPQFLLEKANIKKDVIIIGALYYIEIWDPGTKEKVKNKRGTKGEVEARVDKDLRE